MKKAAKFLCMAFVSFLMVAQVPMTAFATATTQSIAIPAYKYPTTWQTDTYWDNVISAGGSNNEPKQWTRNVSQ